MIEIGGLQKSTLIDYPGRLAATVFLIGCNFRCPWCYSSELVLPEKIEKQPRISEEELFEFLKERKKFLEGVVICGGEPTIHPELPEFCQKIKDLGFLIKLDTNGSNPEMVESLIDKGLIDYVALDVKGSREKYDLAVGVKVDIAKIEETISLLKKDKVDYELRMTVVPTLHSKEDVVKVGQWLKPAKRFFLQGFRPEKTVNPEFEKIKPYSKDILLEVQKEISPFFEVCQVRG